jgi:hypothetical protein
MLKQNGSILTQMPMRFIGGAVCADRAFWSRPGELSNARNGFGNLAAIPQGHLAPSAWQMPYKGGGMSSFTDLRASASLNSLNLAAGINIEGSTSAALTVGIADLQLIVSANGAVTITATVNGTIAGALSGSGSTSATATVSNATLGAIVDALGTAIAAASASATIKALGNMEGEITPFTELSPQNLAAAVWSALSAENDTAGTMGALLNASGAAGDPWSVTLEGTYTAADLLRVAAAILAGKVSGAGTGTETFRSIDDARDAVVSTVDNLGNRTEIVIDPA